MTYNYLVTKIMANKISVKKINIYENKVTSMLDSAELQKLTSFLLQTSTLYRGDHTENDNLIEHFCNLAVVGIKSNQYRLTETTIDSYEQEEHFKYLLNELEKTVNKNNNFKNYFNSTRYLSAIEDFSMDEKISITGAFIHNLYNNHNFNQTTNFISTSTKFSTAEKFANSRNSNKPYVIVALSNLNMQKISSNSLKEIFSSFGEYYFDDIHSELIINKGIFPHYIVGFVDLEENVFYIMDEVMLQISNNPAIEEFNVDQTCFFTCLKHLGLQRYSIIENNEITIINAPWNN